MLGPKILVRSMSKPSTPDKFGNRWQYHSRSDRHSKIACWGILFDLMEHCALLVSHVEAGRVVFGINHEMRDFKLNRKKNLDLVLCTPRASDTLAAEPALTFRRLADKYAIELTADEERRLSKLPDIPAGPVGSVHVALEAKACMTAHIKALPRLYDELNSSHLTIHGSTDLAIAAGFVMINLAGTFVSSDENKFDLRKQPAKVSTHKQPNDALRVVQKVREISRRTKTGEEGFDAIGIVGVSCRNDGSPVELVTKSPPTLSQGEIDHYDMMILRVAQQYEGRFSRL